MYPLEEAKNDIQVLLEQVLKKLKYKCEVKLESPTRDLGDFAFPCFPLAKIARKPPRDIASEIAKNLKKSRWVKRIETQGAYINFFLNNKTILDATLKTILDNKDKYGHLDKKNKKLIVEHTSANPTGPLHVGRARNPIIGDTIVRIFKTAGYNVESQFYLDDMGKQVAMLAWGVNNLKEKDVPKSDYDKTDHKKVGFYQKASELMNEDVTISVKIDEIIRKSEEGDGKTLDMVHKAYSSVINGIKESLARINISVDKYVPESNFVKDKSVDFVVEKLKKSTYCGKENGAYFIDLEPFGIKGRNTKFIFLRKDGTTLYATRDIAYHIWKAEHADLLINILGEDHKLESKQVEIALNIIEAKMVPNAIFYSFVSLPGGKMSTRRGRVVSLDELIDECVDRAYNEVKKRRGKDLSDKKMKEISEIVGIGALRYNIIKVQPEKDIVFKWEEALNFEGNASPFIQYSHARACSILDKNKEKLEKINADLLKHDSEIGLVKKLARFPFVIEEACNSFKPHVITTYLFEIASQFNQFYRDCPVLHEKNKELRLARLGLTDATRIVIRNGLDLLGIVAPKEM